MRTTTRWTLAYLLSGGRASVLQLVAASVAAPRKETVRVVVRRVIAAAALAVCLAVAATGALQAETQLIQGTTGEGSLYEFAIPDNWNGVLAVYAHGIVNPLLPVALPGGSFIPFRNALLAQNVAVAYSSFSENGFAVKDGEQRTHQLLGLFKSQVGKPSRVYIMGHSLGGTIAMGLAEKHASQYDGALPMCGFVGGSIPEVNYLANVRILFDAFFPGVLAGDVFNVPVAVAINPGPSLAAAQAALIGGLPSGKTLQLAALAKVPGANAGELIQSILTALGFSLIFTNDVLDRTHGRYPFDNTMTDYGLEWVNAAVGRFSSSPDAVNYLKRYETPTGKLGIPTVTLHTSRDEVAPIFHEALYRDVVAAANASALLRQRTVVRYGHCAFTVGEMMQAFGELRAWVEQDIVPAP